VLQALTNTVAKIVAMYIGNLRGVKASLFSVGEDYPSIACTERPKACGTDIYVVFSMFIPALRTLSPASGAYTLHSQLIITVIDEPDSWPRMLMREGSSDGNNRI
jgi:hypothetical protein